jgi:hypothetical protein
LLFAVPSFLSSNFINSDSVAAVRGGDYSVSVAVVELLFIDELFLASVAVAVLAILISFGA